MTKNLMTALCAAMGEMRDPVKRSQNPHFRSRFADLSEVLDCIEGPLHKHGLVFVQLLKPDSGGNLMLHSQVHHAASGEVLEAVAPIVAEKPGPQALGSAISYMRRYSAKAMFSLADADEDDDAERATNRSPHPQATVARKLMTTEPAPAPMQRKPAPKLEEGIQRLAKCETVADLKATAAEFQKMGYNAEQLDELRAAFMARREALEEQ
jgi:ERF superfamily